ncbi:MULTISPECIES: YncE family protein [Acidobacteriaceae]|uniref:YncE family protein n=1 Tax=Acidobacteriaceae TaxID=204434 RepID=UPI0020B139E9|nr:MULTISPECIES: YncE family protein [Acidobacteriaceae]MDW5265416.1 YncE family protein [Edaphobacter sp.]
MHSARIESEANTQAHGQHLPRSVARFAFRFALVAAVSASLIGCGNTYRPVVTAINPVGPAAQPPKYAVAISTTGASTPGLVTFVDFSGDTVLITASIGVDPYYLALDSTGDTGYTLNRDATVSGFGISTSLLSTQVSQITLLSGADPVSILPLSTHSYVAEPGRSAIGDLTGAAPALNLNQEFGPVPNGTYVVGLNGAPRVYALGADGSGNGQAYTLETATNTFEPTPIAIGKNPVYGVMTADGRRAFTMNKGDGTVSVINSQTNQLDSIPSTGKSYIPVGTNPVWADFAPTLNELVVANAGDGTTPGTVSIISIPLCSATALPSNPNCDPNNPVDTAQFGTVLATVPVGINPVMVAVLQDGTRAYVANAGDPTLPCAATAVAGVSTVCSVSVINLTSNTVTTTITGLPDLSATSLPNSTCTTSSPKTICGHPGWIAVTTGSPSGKVYVTSLDSTNLSIIRTDIDSIDTIIPLQGKGVSVRVTGP